MGIGVWDMLEIVCESALVSVWLEGEFVWDWDWSDCGASVLGCRV